MDINNINEAFEILEIEETEDFELIEKQFEKLLKKYKYKDLNNLDDKKNIDDITKAYNFIMEYHGKGNNVKKEYTKKERYINFLHYHKIHILAIIVGGALLYSLIHTIVTNEESDFMIIVEGIVYAENDSLEDTKDFINEENKDIKNSEILVLNLDPDSDPSQLSASTVKSTTYLMSKEGDVYILDKYRYDTMIEEDILDDISSCVDIEDIDEEDIYFKTDEKEIPYGIDVTDNEIIKKMNIVAEELILVKITGREMTENGQWFIDKVLGVEN
jgi:hypothetical protein